MTRDKKPSEIGKVKTAKIGGVKPPDRTMELDLDDLSIEDMAGLSEETAKTQPKRPLPPPPSPPRTPISAKRPAVQSAMRQPERTPAPATHDEKTSAASNRSEPAPAAAETKVAIGRISKPKPPPPALAPASSSASPRTAAASATEAGQSADASAATVTSTASVSSADRRTPATGGAPGEQASGAEPATTAAESSRGETRGAEPTRGETRSAEPARSERRGATKRAPERPVERPAAPRAAAELTPLRAGDLLDPAQSSAAPLSDLALDAASLVGLCESELSRASDPADKGRLHFEIARLFEYPLADLQKAATHYREATRLLPEHVPSVRGARRVHTRLKRYQDALTHLGAETRLAADKLHRAALTYRRGRLLDDELGQKAKAREAFIEALELNSNDLSALAAVARTDLAASSWAELFRTLERISNAIVADPLLRSAIGVLRAWLAEVRLNNPVLAAELCDTALELNPQSRAALSTLQRLLRSQGRYQELLRAQERELDLLTDVRAKAVTLRQMATVALGELSDRARSIELLERALALAPTDVQVMRDLAPLYHDAQRFADEASLLQRLVPQLEDEAECLTLLLRIARLFEFELDDGEEAIKWNEVAMRFAPHDREAFDALRKLYREAGNWSALIELETEAANALRNTREQAAALCEIGRLHEQHVADKNAAISCHDRALSLAPDYAPAFKELVRLYSETRQHRPLIELHERAVDIAPDPRIAIAHLFKCGAIYEDALGDFGQALFCYQRVLELEPGHLGAIFAMQRAAEGAGRYRELVAAIELEASQIKDKSRIVSLLHRAGQILESHLEDKDAAMQLYRKVRTLDRGFTPVLQTMAVAQRRDSRWADLNDTLRALLELEHDGEQAAALLLQMADVAENQLGRAEEALALARQALTRDSSSRVAAARVFDLLRRLGKWSDLAEILEGRIARLHNGDERAAAWVSLAMLHEQKLQQPDKATACYKKALEIRAAYRPAIDGWLRLRIEQKQFKELAAELVENAAKIEDAPLREQLERELANIRADRLSDVSGALELVRAGLERGDDDALSLLVAEQLATRSADDKLRREVLTRLCATVRDDKALIAVWRELARTIELQPETDNDAIERALEAILRIDHTDRTAVEELEMLAFSEGREALLSQVERRQADLSNDPASVAESWTRRGETVEREDPVASLSAYKTALELDPQSVAASAGIVRAATAVRDARILAEGLRQLARVTRDPARAAEILVRSARVRVAQLDNELGAITDLEQALELDPDNENAALSLTPLLHGRKDIQRLVEQFSRAASRAKKAERAVVLWLQTADLYSEHQSNPSAAIAILRRVLKSNPNEQRALRRLAGLHEREAQWAPAVEVIEKLLASTTEKEEQLALRMRLAAHYADQLANRERAIDHLQNVLRVDAGAIDALRRLSLLYLESDPAQAAQTARRWVRACADVGERADALYLTYLAEEKLGREAVAIDALKEAVGLTGPESNAAAAYEAWLAEHGGYDGYASALREHIEFAAENGTDSSASELRLAQILGRHLDQPEEAAELLQRSMRHGASADDRKELAQYLRRSRQFTAALDELTKVIPEEVGNAEFWREIADIHQIEKRPREARLALSILAVLGDADDDERRLLNEWAPRPASARGRTFASSAIRAISLPKAFHPAAGELLESLGEGLPKLFPTNLDSYGLGTRDKIEADSENAHRRRADRLANIFGVTEHDLYIYLVQGRGVVLEPTQPPSVMFPASFAQLGETQQTFALARPFAYLALHAPLAHKLPPRGLDQLLIASARTADPHYAMGRGDEEAINQLAKRIPKSLSRRNRRAFEEAAQHYARGPALDAQAFSTAVHRSAIRMAAMVADDLQSAVAMLFTTEPDLRNRSVADVLAEDSVIRDLLVFWMSEAAVEHRRRSGLLPAS